MEFISLPPPAQTTPVTVPLWPDKTATSLLSRMSHILMVRSSLPVMRRGNDEGAGKPIVHETIGLRWPPSEELFDFNIFEYVAFPTSKSYTQKPQFLNPTKANVLFVSTDKHVGTYLNLHDLKGSTSPSFGNSIYKIKKVKT